MSTTASKVALLVKSFGDNAFTRGDLLDCGPEDAVDAALSRLKAKGLIRGLASGIYILSTAETPSAEKIAEIKAARFGKLIVATSDSGEKVFRTDGCKSSFETVHGRLQLKHEAPARIKHALGIADTSPATTEVPTTLVINPGSTQSKHALSIRGRAKPSANVELSDAKMDQLRLIAGKLFQLLARLTESDTVPMNIMMIESAVWNLIQKAEKLLQETE